MKRLKYKLIKYIKGVNHVRERKIMAAKYVKVCSLKKVPSLRFCMGLYLSENFQPHSKINTYCLITGRTRFTVAPLHISRHIFFEFCSKGVTTGFFFSSQ